MRTSPSGPDTERFWGDPGEVLEQIACEVPGEHRMDILTAGDGLMIQAGVWAAWGLGYLEPRFASIYWRLSGR